MGAIKLTGLFEIILVYSFSGIPTYTHLSKQYILFGITDPRPCASRQLQASTKESACFAVCLTNLNSRVSNWLPP